MNGKELLHTIGELDEDLLAAAAPGSAKPKFRSKAPLLLAAMLALCAVVGTGILMKNATPPVSADPGIPAVCAEQGHDYSIVNEVGTGKILVECAVCHHTENLYDQVDESEYDSDESHFNYVAFREFELGWSDGHYHSETFGSEDCILVTGYTGSNSKVKVPATIDGRPVFGVDMVENSGDQNITSIIFSEGILAVFGRTGFRWCNLESVYFPSDMVVIGFIDMIEAIPEKDRYWLDGIVGENIADMDYYGPHQTPFFACSKLENVYLPEGLWILENDPFSCCFNLHFVSMPSTLFRIYGFASGRKDFRYYVSPQNPIFCNVEDVGKASAYRFMGTDLITGEEIWRDIPKCAIYVGLFEDDPSLETVPGEEGYTWFNNIDGSYHFFRLENGKKVEITDPEEIAALKLQYGIYD